MKAKEKFTDSRAFLIIIGAVIGILIMVFVLLAFNHKYNSKLESSNHLNSNETSEELELDESNNNSEVEDNYNNNNSSNTDNNNISNNNDATSTTDSASNSSSTDQQLPNKTEYTENDVINYFSEQENLVSTYSNSNMTEGITDKLKTSFTTLVDFIFYNGTIKGYTFNELSNSAKLKTISILLSIDNKIESYFPSYKDKIESGFTSLKSKLVVKYLEITSTICENAGASACEEARTDFKNMKTSFGITWDLIKDLASSATSTISEWYQSFKAN